MIWKVRSCRFQRPLRQVSFDLLGDRGGAFGPDYSGVGSRLDGVDLDEGLLERAGGAGLDNVFVAGGKPAVA
jgi:hypothetical protein